MSDLESRLTEALNDGATGAPSAIGLAAAARSRARSRRRARVGAVGAVVVLAIGVPTAVVATHGSHDDPAPRRSNQNVATDPAPPGPVVPGGFHYESWHDVSVLVPDSWVYGSLGPCGGSREAPAIARPGPVNAMDCEPRRGYGVGFSQVDDSDDFEWPLVLESGSESPADAYVGARGLNGVLVTVVLPDRALAQQILDSVQHNDVLDPNGCPVDRASDPAFPADAMVVCRYDGDGQLDQSEQLTGSDLDAAQAALDAAPRRASRPACPHDLTPAFSVRLASASEDADLDVHNCATMIVNGQLADVTKDVLYWALSPGWSGSVPAGVSLPSVLRSP
jgi:hypothetical protein